MGAATQNNRRQRWCEHEEQTTGQCLQSVENVWECGNSEGSEGKQAEWNKECYGYG